MVEDRLIEAEYILRTAKYGAADENGTRRIPINPLEELWLSDIEWHIAEGLKLSEVSLRVYLARLESALNQIAEIADVYWETEQLLIGTSLQDDFQAELSQLGDDVAFLQIASFADQTHFYLMTPDRGFEHAYIEVGEAQIFERISEVRRMLRLDDPDRSSRSRRVSNVSSATTNKSELLAELAGLYGVLFEPVADKLEGTNKLVLNLHGRLRYAPVTALYDGDKGRYLIEDFEISRFTWGELSHEASVDLSNAVGFGMSQETEEFLPLPGVERELASLFATNSQPGPLRGPAKLNEAFTREAFADALSKQPSVVHVASHFDMRAGSEAGDSYLLLGDKGQISLQDFASSPDLTFENVDLLVLSACSTARVTEGSGLEVEGLGAIAQIRGADAVVASLWNVADGSTAQFMEIFYSELARPGATTSEALRNAQLSFIRSDDQVGSIEHNDYSDPYYWAAYILMGGGV